MKYETCCYQCDRNGDQGGYEYRDFVTLSIFIYVYIKSNWGEVLSVIHEVWDLLPSPHLLVIWYSDEGNIRRAVGFSTVGPHPRLTTVRTTKIKVAVKRDGHFTAILGSFNTINCTIPAARNGRGRGLGLLAVQRQLLQSSWDCTALQTFSQLSFSFPDKE